MGGCKINEEQLRAALHAAADSCDPPAGLKQQIDAQLAWQEKKEERFMKKMNMKKVAAAAVMACALTGTVCVAAVKMSAYSTGYSSPADEIDDFSNLSKLAKKAGVTIHAKEVFDNGFAFESANVINGQDFDENGNETGSHKDVRISYKNGEKNVNYTVRKGERAYTDEELARRQPIEADGITYYFNQDNYLFLPGEDDVTEEDKAAEAAGTLYISLGSSEREEQVSTHLTWNADGQQHSLSGFDLDMSAEELVQMAQQMK